MLMPNPNDDDAKHARRAELRNFVVRLAAQSDRPLSPVVQTFVQYLGVENEQNAFLASVDRVATLAITACGEDDDLVPQMADFLAELMRHRFELQYQAQIKIMVMRRRRARR